MVQLSDNDAQILRETLTTYLVEFRREVAGTENPNFRHELQQRQKALERILKQLGAVKV